MRDTLCKKCGRKISDQYSFCTYCLTPIPARTTERTIRANKIVGRSLSHRETPKSWLGKLNSVEKYYTCAYLLSIILGIIFGFVDKMFYYMALTSIHTPYDVLTIFAGNFKAGLLSAMTGGSIGLLSNFVTFAAVPGLFETKGISFVRAIFILGIAFATYWSFEIAGELCLSLAGLTFWERIFKHKTQIRSLTLFIMGSALLLLAALLEWIVGTHWSVFLNHLAQ
jgi:hypothetical protein